MFPISASHYPPDVGGAWNLVSLCLGVSFILNKIVPQTLYSHEKPIMTYALDRLTAGNFSSDA